jgi:PadR family transcriptional regulator, regulatory protein PadR
MSTNVLSPLQRQLLAILDRDGELYGVPLLNEINEGRPWLRQVSIGSLYDAMDRLEDQGMVTSRRGDPTPERGNRRKRFWTLTEKGRAALRGDQ